MLDYLFLVAATNQRGATGVTGVLPLNSTCNILSVLNSDRRRWNPLKALISSLGVCAEEASRGRVPAEDGGALWMCPLHGEPRKGSFVSVRLARLARPWLHTPDVPPPIWLPFSMPTQWPTCWTSGGCSAPGSSGNPAFSTGETTSKTSADWAGSSAKSSS